VRYDTSIIIDYSYNLNLLSGTLYDKSIDSVYVLHNADNLSDHEPIILKLI